MSNCRTFALCCAVACVVGGCAREGTCYTRAFGDSRSYELLDERTTLTFEPQTDSVVALAADSAIGMVLGAAVDFAEEQIRKESARYIQSYSASGYHFAPSFDEIVIRRYVRLHSDKKGSPETKAAKIEISAKPLDGADGEPSGMYELVVKSIDIDYAKAKVLNRRWKKPDVVDLDIAFSIEGIWTTKAGKLERHALVSGGAAKVKKVEIGGKTKKGENGKHLASLGFVYIPQNATSLALRGSAVITERDPSKASEYLSAGADLLAENRESIVGAATGEDNDSGTP